MSSFLMMLYGKRGSGKTSLLAGDEAIPFKGLLACAGKPVFCLDSVNAIDRGWLFDSVGHLAEYMRAVLHGDSDPAPHGIYTVKATSKEIAEDFLRFASLYRLPCTVVIDEISTWTRGSVHPDLYELVHFGRNWDASVIGTARRPTEVHPDFRSQMDVHLTFQQAYEGDVEKLAKTKNDAEVISNLRGHQFTMVGYADVLPFAEQIRTLPTYVASNSRSDSQQEGEL